MSTFVKLPELGEGVTEGELVKWLVKPGDTVKPDQAIAEVMTDKATVEVPSPVAGTVKELKFKVGDVIKVESVMLELSAGSAATAAPNASAATTAQPAKTIAQTTTPAAATNSGGQSATVKLPELGEGVTEGELVKWLVKPGDSVKPDQAIAEVMTDKATVEVPSPIAGTVQELKFKVGDVVKVESVMLTLTTSGGQASPAIPTHQAPMPSSMHTAIAQAATQVSTTSTPQSTTAIFPPVADSKVLATPATRRLAREMGIDINQLQGTGLAGRVTREDVVQAQKSGSTASVSPAKTATTASTMAIPKPAYAGPQGATEERVPLAGIRKKIAENMQKSKLIIPHFTIMDEADVTELVNMRDSMKDAAEKAGTKITYLPIVMKALIATVREFPMFNASIDDAAQEIVYKKYFNVGFAADTPNGLLVPVIKNADQKTMLELSREILDLAKRGRDGKLKPDEMKGACITVTNIGSIGGTYATPVINHPEVAILGMYKIQDKLVLDNKGQVTVRKVMNFTATCDHRLIDGAVAANFLKAFINRIQNPGVLMLDLH